MIPQGRSSWRSESPTASSPNLDGVVGAEHRHRHPAADRADEDDPAAGGADRGQHRLRDRDLGDQVDLELAAEVVDRQRLQRPRDRDAGVVDQAVEAGAVRVLRNPSRRRRDLLLIGDVEEERAGAGRSHSRERSHVLLPADTGVDPPSPGVEPEHRRPPDPGRGAGDQGGSHIRQAIRATSAPASGRDARSRIHAGS